MKENPFDRIEAKALHRVEKATDRIAKNFKGTNPFDKEPINDRDIIDSVDMLTPQDLQELIEDHGYEQVNEFLGSVEALKAKRRY